MLDTCFSATMLAIESNEVIGLRLTKLAAGGSDAMREMQRMWSEKVCAFVEASVSVVGGATPATVIGRYREHVRANATRLTS